MRSLKEIVTESHDGWTDYVLQTEHNFALAVAEAKGRISERGTNWETLKQDLSTYKESFDCEHRDMDDFESAFRIYTAQIDELMAIR